jgi:DNA-binding NarL/FixJ family response regulator
VRIVIGEDSVLLREGLIRLVREGGHCVAAAVGDAPSLLSAISETRPDVALVDVRMPPSFTDDGLRATVEARRRQPGLAVLVLSQYVEEAYAHDLLADGGRGVGYLLKDRVQDLETLVDALTRVAGGGSVLDPEVVAQLLIRRRSGVSIDSLSQREREVLGLMAEGRTNSAIAQKLMITDGAVEKHVSAIFTKLGLPPSEADHRRVLAVLAWLRGGASR